MERNVGLCQMLPASCTQQGPGITVLTVDSLVCGDSNNERRETGDTILTALFKKFCSKGEGRIKQKRKRHELSGAESCN